MPPIVIPWDSSIVQPKRSSSVWVIFNDSGMSMPKEGGEIQRTAYDEMELIAETADGLLLAFKTNAVILQKKDLMKGSVDELSRFLMGKVSNYHVIR